MDRTDARLNVEPFRRLLKRETDEVASADLKAVRTGIGAALRALHSDVLREEVPDRIAVLLRQLDQQKGTGNA
jgi:histone H3/H4